MNRLVLAILFLLFFFSASPASAAGIYTTDKLITVDLGKQMLFVWDNGQIINKTKVSTGLPKAPTVKGSFKIRTKILSQTMKGQSKAYGKYLYKNVPHVMYFFQDYALHGAYWHNRFGAPASHGCVNMPVSFAKWLYEWAPVETRVEVF